jgi:hypothetical protein
MAAAKHTDSIDLDLSDDDIHETSTAGKIEALDYIVLIICTMNGLDRMVAPLGSLQRVSYSYIGYPSEITRDEKNRLNLG